MATLQKIRNRAGLLIAIVVGMALFAFILGDALSSGSQLLSRKQMEVAEIDGESISYQEYNAKIEGLSEFYRANYQVSSLDQETMESIREEVWQNTVRDIVLGERVRDLGIRVSVEELKTMLMGDSINTGGTSMVMDEPHPIVRRMFTNPETGEFNRMQMMNYFNTISDEVYKNERKRWVYIEDQLVNERLGQKYFSMVRKGLQPNVLEAQNFAKENTATVDFNFVSVSMNTIPDEEVTVTEEEIKKYYEEHKNEFQQKDERSLEYVIFNIQPSKEDDALAYEFVEQSKTPFERAPNAVNFVNSNSDLPYVQKSYGYNELPEKIRDSIFNAQPGYVAGPYFDNEAYKLARLIDFVQVPDSVRARHILISLSVQRDEARAKAIADSLKTLIDNGQSFEMLANEYSADQSNKQIGGDLGWFTEGTMVKPFSDAAFSGKTGDVVVVKTRFGYHVIKIEDQSPRVKKADLAILIRQLMPSDETYQTIYSQAVQFRAEAKNLKEFRDLYAKENITPRFATDFAKDAKQLPGLEDSREIIRWAFENEKNSISQIFDLNDMYIVAALTDVKEKGVAKLERVRTEIEIAIRKQQKLEKLKETVAEKISSVNSIDDAAEALNTEVQKAEKVRFSNPYVNGSGLEPKVVALAFLVDQEKLSKPVIGENAVFVIQVSEKSIPETADITSAEFRLKYAIDSRAAFEGYEALKEKADIEDKRIKFY